MQKCVHFCEINGHFTVNQERLRST